MNVEKELQQLVILRYGTVADFIRKIGIPYSTFKSIINRGVSNSSFGNILKICHALKLNPDELEAGRIVFVDDNEKVKERDIESFFSDLRMNEGVSYSLDNIDLTPEELDRIFDSVEVTIGVIRKRRNDVDRLKYYLEKTRREHVEENYSQKMYEMIKAQHSQANKDIEDISKIRSVIDQLLNNKLEELEKTLNDSALLQSIDERTES